MMSLYIQIYSYIHFQDWKCWKWEFSLHSRQCRSVKTDQELVQEPRSSHSGEFRRSGSRSKCSRGGNASTDRQADGLLRHRSLSGSGKRVSESPPQPQPHDITRLPHFPHTLMSVWVRNTSDCMRFKSRLESVGWEGGSRTDSAVRRHTAGQYLFLLSVMGKMGRFPQLELGIKASLPADYTRRNLWKLIRKWTSFVAKAPPVCQREYYTVTLPCYLLIPCLKCHISPLYYISPIMVFQIFPFM